MSELCPRCAAKGDPNSTSRFETRPGEYRTLTVTCWRPDPTNTEENA